MQLFTTVLELIAGALIVFGVWLVCEPAAFVTAGVLLLAFSYGLTPKPGGSA